MSRYNDYVTMMAEKVVRQVEEMRLAGLVPHLEQRRAEDSLMRFAFRIAGQSDPPEDWRERRAKI